MSDAPGNWRWWMRRSSSAVLALLGGAAALWALGTPEEHGKDLFERRCSGCHALDIDKEGPRLRGVYGRKAGSMPGFEYSEGLKKSAIRWDKESLERWLAGPDAMVPDTDMAFRVANGDERTALIAYLKSLAIPAPASAK
jgi:cytochrome c